MLGSHLPLSALIAMCHAVRHYLLAGLTLQQVFKQQADSGPRAMRGVAGEIHAEISRGNDLASALKKQGERFPQLFQSLVEVGEKSGMLPEVLGELEQYYLRQQALRRDFFGRITWPVTQLVMAVLVVAGLIFILDFLPRNPGQPRYDPLGLGLFGSSGALWFLGIVAAVVGGMFGLYYLVTRGLRQRAWVDAFLLGVPALGPCLRALALGRFCMALSLTSATGMSVPRSLRLSFRAAGNEAFASRAAKAIETVKAGDELTEALRKTRLFPEDFLLTMRVGEESGQITEVLKRQATHYHEEAGRRLSALTAVAGYGVWLACGGLIVMVIFRLYGSYLSMLN